MIPKSKPKSKLVAKKKLGTSKKPIKQLKAKADKAFSLACRYRFSELVDGVVLCPCITCGVWKPIKEMQCGHFQSRRYNSTRWNEENTASQCMGCNVFNHGQQYKFGVEIDKLYGGGTAKRLAKEAQGYFKVTVEFLETVIADSNEQILFYEDRYKGI